MPPLNPKINIFLVDDDAVFLQWLKIEFAEHPVYHVKTFATGELCIANLEKENPDLIILDYNLNGLEKKAMNGLQTLCQIKICKPNLPVIMLTSRDKIEVAVNCMQYGALDYVVKSTTAFMRIEKNIHAFFQLRNMEKEESGYGELCPV